MDTPAETPISELADMAAKALSDCGGFSLHSGPGSFPVVHNFTGVVGKELALRIADRNAARAHAVTCEQTSLFVDSEPLADGLMGVAKFLRSLAGDQACRDRSGTSPCARAELKASSRNAQKTRTGPLQVCRT